ncbi:uncharacterized protein GIQ15_05701 [Arthroderma uncinatum]|uniref:uncharacterized protein n=1 Tax=Arthroderma uncinatum TaxID=74035 RepID=UPI00144A7020|nr:uncharacterized protein GIQ15_05701 [Arthroderma uncinatum]KAF3480354.1 hypothetical protein GIQ15_05701 [Arthroderma uncinatum]
MPSQDEQREQDESWASFELDLDLDLANYPEARQDLCASIDPQLQQWQGNIGPEALPTPMEEEAGMGSRINSLPDISSLMDSNQSEDEMGLLNNIAGADASLCPPTQFNGSQLSQVKGKDDDSLSSRLPDLQRKLHILSGSFQREFQDPRSEALYTSGIEETFTATETLVDIINTFHELNILGGPMSPKENSPRLSGLRGYATVLLIYSCYLHLLSVYELLVASLSANVQRSASQHEASRFSFLQQNSTSANFRPLDSSPIDIPVLNIGQFSLAASPRMNLGLLLHFIQETVDRMQTAIQTCASMPQHGITDGLRHTGRKASSSWYGADVPFTRDVDGRSSMFDGILSDIEMHEKELTGNLNDLKGLLKGKSSSRPGYG